MAKCYFGPRLSITTSMKLDRRFRISRRRPTRVIRAPSSAIRPTSATCSRSRSFAASLLLFERSARLDMHAKCICAVVTGLTVDGDAAVVVGVVHACRSWRPWILGGPLRAVDRALSGCKWTTGKLYVEFTQCRRALIGDIPVLLHVNNSRGTVLGTLASVIGQADGKGTGLPNQGLIATRQNDQQSQHYNKKSKTTLGRSHGRFLSSKCATLPR